MFLGRQTWNEKISNIRRTLNAREKKVSSTIQGIYIFHSPRSLLLLITYSQYFQIIIYEELNFNHRKTKLYECHERNSNLSRKLLR